MKKILSLFFLFGLSFTSLAQVWQWSVSVDSVISSETNTHPQAYLWIPENCKYVKGVVFTQHNMIEEGMLENVSFRKTMTDLGFAEVWVTPAINITFDFAKDAGEDFVRMMELLAQVSGYKELTYAPVIPMGHSALASFPWNFAAWDKYRTLALVSVHGDAPQTHLTGSGRPNPEWGDRNIDGVPALFIMGEYEWWEDRITPAFDYMAKHPNSVISLFADAGHGHFDYSEGMINYVCQFIRKAAKKRLPVSLSGSETYTLKSVDPEEGWLMDRWHKDSLPHTVAAPYAKYSGDKKTASWVFDKEMADATEQIYAKVRGKVHQYIGFKQYGQILQPVKTHSNYNLKFLPLGDGITFTLSAFISDTSRILPITGFAKTKLSIDRICGPVRKISDTTFQIGFYRLGFNNSKRSNDIWLLASTQGDKKCKSSIQQLDMHFPLKNTEGIEQTINFPVINNITQAKKSIKLAAVSNAAKPIGYYVKAGPAYIEEDHLILTPVPPKTKFPVKITVVAWQYGIQNKIKTAEPVEQSFFITK